VLKALDAITRRADETYEQYIDRVVEDSLAIRVKINDLADKMDLLHVEQLDPSDLKRYNKQLAAYHRMKKLVQMAKARMSVPVDSKRA
jgi:NADPH-dependent ferric siderophore reductase